MKFNINLNLNFFHSLKVNRLIRFFVIADLMFWGGWGLITPILAIFIVNRIEGASVLTVGIASAIYWIVKALFQLPVAILLDRHEGEKDDFYTLVSGLMLASLASFAFLSVETVSGLYSVVFIQALAFGLYTPSWSAIFSRHLDKKSYAFDWSLDNTAVGLALGLTAFVGSAIAKIFGFGAIFICTGLLSFASAILLLFVPNLVLPKPVSEDQPKFIDHTPANVGK